MNDIERCYEELRRVIDGGSESMTHADALATVKFWSKWTAPSAEPIAWRIAGRFGWTYQEEPPYDAQRGRVAEPLYATPPDHREVMRQALEALEAAHPYLVDYCKSSFVMAHDDAIDALRAALGETR